MIALEDIRVELGGKPVLADVSASFDGPGVSAIIGPSGCGKSTLLRTILGLVPITRGRVVVDGEPLPSGDALRRLRRRFGYVIQSGGLFPHLTAGSNVLLPARHAGMGRAAAGRRLDELADLVRLHAGELRRYPAELSGGQRQRVAIARALAVEPQMLICDEPTSALDVSVQAQVINLLMDIREQHGVAYLFIGHNLHLVRHISETVGVMYRGYLVETGPTWRVYREPAHPYTQMLLEAVPVPNPLEQKQRASRRRMLDRPGSPMGEAQPAGGCPFQGRCPLVMDICRQTMPPPTPVPGGGDVRCHLFTT